MIATWIRTLALPLLAVLALSACQSQAYRGGYAAAPSCDVYRTPQQRTCYQRPARYTAPPVRYARVRENCAPIYRPLRPSYRPARAPANCGYVERARPYRYQRPVSRCKPTIYRAPAAYRAPTTYDAPYIYRDPTTHRRSYRRGASSYDTYYTHEVYRPDRYRPLRY